MTTTPSSIENELDIRKLFHILWRGKLWIIGLFVVFAALALTYSYLVKQEWVSVATVTKPSITMLNGYYDKQRTLTSLSSDETKGNVVTNDVYQTFLQQLDAYDTKRDFWLQNDYYLQRKENDKKADAALLAQFINNIQRVIAKQPAQTDNIQLVAETAEDAQRLLTQYISFAAKKSVDELNQELMTQWAESFRQYSAKINQQQLSADMNYQKQIDVLKQLMGHDQTNSTDHQLLLKEFESIVSNNLQLDQSYYQNQVIAKTLSQPLEPMSFQPYRFLRTPDEPVTRSKPRRLFLLILWGGIGAFCGVGVALFRRKSLDANV